MTAYFLSAPRKMKFSDLTGSIRSERGVDAFVDDTLVGLTDYPGEKPMSALTMLKLLEKCAQTWQNLLFASGGVLEVSKCYYYMIQWYWDAQGYPKMTEFRQYLNNPGKHNFGSGEYQTLNVTSGTDPIQVVIRNKSVRNSSKILGVMISMNNDWNDMMNRLAIKSNNHARLTLSHRHRRCNADL